MKYTCCPLCKDVEEMLARCNEERMDQLKKYAYRFTVNDDDAMDLIQEGFLNVWKKRHSLHFEHLNGLTKFIKQDIYWKATTIHQKRIKKSATFSDADAESIGRLMPSHLTADRRDWERFVHQACIGKSIQFSLIAQLKFVQEHRNMDIAEMIGCSKVAINTYVSRIRTHLKEHLENAVTAQ